MCDHHSRVVGVTRPIFCLQMSRATKFRHVWKLANATITLIARNDSRRNIPNQVSFLEIGGECKEMGDAYQVLRAIHG